MPRFRVSRIIWSRTAALLQGGVATGFEWLYWIAVLFIFEAAKVSLFQESKKYLADIS